MRTQIYLFAYIPFLITVSILATVIGIVFFSPFFSSKQKKFLWNNFIFCFLLCFLTLICDCFTFPIVENAKNYTSHNGLVWAIPGIIVIYLWHLFGISGLLMAVKTIPLYGKFLMWFTLFAITVPARIFYLVTNTPLSFTDILNLLTVKPQTTILTILPVLTVKIIIKACLPFFIIVLTILILKIHNPESKQEKFQRIFNFAIGILFFIGYCITSQAGISLREGSMNHSLNALQETVLFKEKFFVVSREKVINSSYTPPQHNNLIVIIDESVRGDYLSINFSELKTTPILEKYLQDYPTNFFNYGLMIASVASSSPSNGSILTSLNSIPDKNLRIFSNPTLFDIAKANGYRTVMIALQAGYPDFIIRQSDLNRVDEMYIPKMGWNDFNIDFTEADKLRKLLIENKGLFIYLIKIGVHSPYQIRYPADNEHKIFTPALDLYEQVELSKRQKVVNTYKNAIHYNIDGFFKHLLGDNLKELKDCTIIYTSDHADCLFEYGVCGHFANALIEQNIVPFLIFSTDSWVLENLKRPSEIPFTLHHMNIAPTIQSILCRDLNYHSGDYSSLVSVEDFKKPPLVYVSKGTVWDGEISSPVSVDENGKIILPVEKYMY